MNALPIATPVLSSGEDQELVQIGTRKNRGLRRLSDCNREKNILIQERVIRLA